MTDRRERSVAAALGLSTAALAFLVLEGLLRLLPWQPTEVYPQVSAPREDLLFQYDPVLLWRQRPDAVSRPPGSAFENRTNALGLRDDPFPPEGGAGFSVLCLGDSATWGDGVPAHLTYANVLEELLARRDPRAAVLNAGVPGYSSVQSLGLERELLARFDFDLVVISLYHADMFLARLPDAAYLRTGVGGATLGALSRSVAFRWARALTVADAREGVAGWEGWGRRVPAHPDFERQLDAMVSAARADGAEVVLMAHFPLFLDGDHPPPPGPLPPAELAAFMVRLAEGEPEYRRAIAEVARARDVAFVDMAEVVSRDGRRAELYSDHVHPNAEGHRLIAEALVPLAEHARAGAGLSWTSR
jgi:lysophospholipase L1-like esterase